MKIVVVGANGTVGRAVVEELSRGGAHEVIRVGRSQGDYLADMSQTSSLEALFDQIGRVDALVAVAGNVAFGPITTMTAAEFNLGLQDKLMGQINLVLVGQHYLNDGGSITLTSGITGQEPIAQGSNATTVNAGLEGFVQAAACELPRGIRINVINPTLLTESLDVFGPFFPGFESVPAEQVARAYRRSIEGVQTGRVYKVGH